jgi:hypothetical protein
MLGSVLSTAVLCLFSAGCRSNDAAAAASRDEATPGPEMRTSSRNVTAQQLLADYQRDAAVADSKYKGRLLGVSGKVTTISRDPSGAVSLVIGPANQLIGVHASLRMSEVGEASSLLPGNPVTVLCAGSGVSMGSPMLDDCTIQVGESTGVAAF